MLRYVLRNQASADFPCPEGFPPALHLLLAARGIASLEEMKAFLSPSARDLHDPRLLNDIAMAVERLQQALVDQGYLVGKVDGVFGNKTAEAVRMAQAEFGMTQTGVADDAFQEKLFAEK